MELQITDKRSLQEASAYLHDAVFSFEDIEYDKATRTLILKVWRELWEEATSERFLLFLRRWKSPHVRCLLKLENVLECNIDVTDKLDRYEISSLQFDAKQNEVHIIGNYCIKVILKIESLKASLHDLDERTSEGLNKTTIGLASIR